MLVAGSFWLGGNRRIAADYGDEGHVADWFMIGANIEQLDDNGSAQRTLQSGRIVHFADDQTTTLNAPEMTLSTANGLPWRVVSVQGWISGDQKEIRLLGDVHMDRDASGKQPPIQIETADLTLFPEREYAVTEQTTHVVRPGHRMKGIGMEAWLDQNARIVLHSKVRGHHEPTK
ncbi:MAG: LPS export ABC transporter periplasmic protein LptC [Chromatiales bacterium]|nr:LPS export ABC transporter periplasmic protein LptC [Chromatiales bacterium]